MLYGMRLAEHWFSRQCERGHGDYTAERDRLLGNPTVDELVKSIEQRRSPATRRRETER
jgi:hypothetical protein